MGKKTDVGEQITFSETPGKKRKYLQQKKGRATLGKYKEAVKTWREKIRKTKAKLDVNLDTVVNENKFFFFFCKYINSKRRATEHLHPLLDMAGSVTTEDKENSPPGSLRRSC